MTNEEIEIFASELATLTMLAAAHTINLQVFIKTGKYLSSSDIVFLRDGLIELASEHIEKTLVDGDFNK